VSSRPTVRLCAPRPPGRPRGWIVAGVVVVAWIVAGVGPRAAAEPGPGALTARIPVTCGYSADATWTSTSTTPAVVGACSLTVPTESTVVIFATGSLVQRPVDDDSFAGNGSYDARLALSIDDDDPDRHTDQVVTVDGYDLDVNHPVSRTFALSRGSLVNAGAHTITLLGSLEPRTGSRMFVVDASIVAIAAPTGSSSSAACWSDGRTPGTDPEPGDDRDVIARSSAVVTAVSCSVEASTGGVALVVATGHLVRAPGETGQPYEARLTVHTDAPAGVGVSAPGSAEPEVSALERRAAVDDGPTRPFTASSIGVVAIVPVEAGLRTFDLRVARAAGSGTVVLRDPGIAVVVFPAGSPAIASCSSARSGLVAVTAQSPSWQSIEGCTVEAGHRGVLVATATATLTVDNGVGYTQARFRTGLGSADRPPTDPGTDPRTDRWADSFQDHSSDGFDQSITSAVITQVAPGSHTLSMVGQRAWGNGVPVVRDPSVSALLIAADVPPNAPTGVTASAGSASAEVSWTAPAPNGGSAPTGYRVSALPGGVTVRVGADATSVTVAPLPDGVYTFTVTAFNEAGPGPASAPSGQVTLGSPVHAPPGISGYWLVDEDGIVYAFGDARSVGDASSSIATARVAGSPGLVVVDLVPTASAGGYWLLDSTGAVHPFGNAVGFGGIPAGQLLPDERAVSLSVAARENGYWVFTSRGRVFRFGNVGTFGDLTTVRLNGPVLDSVRSAGGDGYYMVASDGGVFAFGDATFHGSMGDRQLNAPVRSLVPDPDGVGYWLVAADGGVFAFAAGFRGSLPGVLAAGQTLNEPIVGMVASGNGYLMVAEDGGVFAFSDRPFHGSLGSNPPARTVTAVAAFSI
jgi:Fibronectin type III domain